MSIPVVIANNGFGIPVIPVEKNAPPAVIASNGFGTPLVIVDKLGTPMIIDGLPDPEPEEP